MLVYFSIKDKKKTFLDDPLKKDIIRVFKD